MEELKENSKCAIMLHQTIADTLKLNITDHKCLDFINRSEGVTAGQIAEFAGLTGGAVTALIDRLEKAGYIIRDKDPKDRRKVILRSTTGSEDANAGSLQLKEIFSSLDMAIDELLSTYDENELTLIFSFINSLNIESAKIIKKLI
ncbi:MAG: MarR family transcriptional regulator [Bacillota bacterium]|nr:MarR family transcriptional regulator [Bacillota bacterium]